MQTGDVVTCRASRGYCLTTGKEYRVLEYQPEAHDINFTWPAYVKVQDDYGKEVWCHACRFE